MGRFRHARMVLTRPRLIYDVHHVHHANVGHLGGVGDDDGNGDMSITMSYPAIVMTMAGYMMFPLLRPALLY